MAGQGRAWQGGAGQDRAEQGRIGQAGQGPGRTNTAGQVVRAGSQASSHIDKQSGRADQHVKNCWSIMSS